MLVKSANWPAAAFDAWITAGIAARPEATNPVLVLPGDKRLTSKLLDRIRTSSGRRISLRDPAVPGLECRIGSRGRVWYVARKVYGKTHKTTLTFDAGDDEIAAAQEAARGVRKAIKAGADPAGDRRRQQALDRAAAVVAAHAIHTVGDLIDRCGEDAKGKQRTWQSRKDVMRYNLGLVGALDLRPGDLTKEHIKAILIKGRERGSPVTVRRAVTYLRSVYRWAVKREHVATDPTAGIDAAFATELVGNVEERTRERVLSDIELRKLWPVLITRAFSDHYAAAFTLLLLTGQRRDEVGGMRWADVDLDAGTWTQQTNKADRLHVVPLVATAIAIIGARRNVKGARPDLVLSTSQGGPLTDSGAGNWRKVTVWFSKLAGIEATWTRHDLRRTVATIASRLGQPLSAVQAILNHSPGSIEGVTAIYRRHDRAREARAALEAVEKFLRGGCAVPEAEIVEMKRWSA